MAQTIDFFIEEKSSGRRLYIPIPPNELSVSSGANTIPIHIINTGEMKLPRGVRATGYSWEGTLPGESMKSMSFVSEWQEPKAIIDLIEKWKAAGTALRLVVGAFVNEDVFVETFNRKYFGLGHCKYNITLTKMPNLVVTTSPAPVVKKAATSTGGAKASTKTGKVIGSKAVYRKGPGKKYKKLGTLKKGTKVTIYATSGNWYKIKEGSPEWWMCSTYISITTGQEQKKKKSATRKSTKKKSGSSKSSTSGKQKYTANVPTTKRVKAAKTAIYSKAADRRKR